MKKKCRIKQEELGLVEAKLRECEKQRDEERRINKKRYDDSLEKQSQVLMCENQIVREKEEFRCKLEYANSKTAALNETISNRVRLFSEKEAQYLMEISSFEDISARNARLQAELKEVAFEHYKMIKRHHEEMEQRKQSSFDTKMVLDHVLRNTIKMFTTDYNLQALEKMDEEAAHALRENVKLNTQFDLREQTCENLIRQQKLSYEKLMKLRLEKEVVGATTIMHQESAERLSRDKEAFEKQQLELTASNNEIEYAIKNLESRVEYKAALLEELSKLKSELKAIKTFRRSKCKKSILTSRKLMEACLAIAKEDREFYSFRIAESFLDAVTNAEKGLGAKEAVEGTEINNSLKRMSRHSSFFSNSAKSLAKGAHSRTLPMMTAEEGDEEDERDDETLSSSDGEGVSPTTRQRASTISGISLAANEPVAKMTPVVDYDAMWNSTKSDCGQMSNALRKFLRQQRKLQNY